jgi:lipoate-protein ligase A
VTDTWTVETRVGSVAELHADDGSPPAGRRVRIAQPTEAALVLGSGQGPAVVEAAVVAAEGIAVVRRRTGGGIVLVEPGAQLWLDLWIPADDVLFESDVGRSFDWLGEVWQAALASHGVQADRHGGVLVCGRWGRVVCFAGRGPGELVVGGRKVVGLAQRRGRWGARFQASALLRWEPARLVGLLALSPEQRAEAARDLAEVAAPVPVEHDALAASVLAHLP